MRGLISRGVYQQQKRTYAAIRLQAHWRRYHARTRFILSRAAAVRIQTTVRALLARKRRVLLEAERYVFGFFV